MKEAIKKLRGKWRSVVIMSIIGVLLLSSFAMAITGIVGSFQLKKDNKFLRLKPFD